MGTQKLDGGGGEMLFYAQDAKASAGDGLLCNIAVRPGAGVHVQVKAIDSSRAYLCGPFLSSMNFLLNAQV